MEAAVTNPTPINPPTPNHGNGMYRPIHHSNHDGNAVIMHKIICTSAKFRPEKVKNERHIWRDKQNHKRPEAKVENEIQGSEGDKEERAFKCQ